MEVVDGELEEEGSVVSEDVGLTLELLRDDECSTLADEEGAEVD